VKQNKK